MRRSGITKPVSLQGLRDTYAVRELRRGVKPEVLASKLEPAKGTWPEALERYGRLAGVGI